MTIIITSSANRLLLCSLDPIQKPNRLALDLMCSAKGSIKRLKMSGDRGHPCLVPFDIWNGLESISDV